MKHLIHAKITTVQQLKQSLAERPSKSDMQETLARLFVGFPTAADSDGAKAKVAAYAEAIEDLPPWATRQAATDFNKGIVPEHDGRFLPTPAMLAKRARLVMNEKSHEEYKRLAQEQASETGPEPMTEQERKRRAEQVQRMLSSVSGKA